MLVVGVFVQIKITIIIAAFRLFFVTFVAEFRCRPGLLVFYDWTQTENVVFVALVTVELFVARSNVSTATTCVLRLTAYGLMMMIYYVFIMIRCDD